MINILINVVRGIRFFAYALSMLCHCYGDCFFENVDVFCEKTSVDIVLVICNLIVLIIGAWHFVLNNERKIIKKNMNKKRKVAKKKRFSGNKTSLTKRLDYKNNMNFCIRLDLSDLLNFIIHVILFINELQTSTSSVLSLIIYAICFLVKNSKVLSLIVHAICFLVKIVKVLFLIL